MKEAIMKTKIATDKVARCRKCGEEIPILNPLFLGAIMWFGRSLCTGCNDKIQDDGGKRGLPNGK
jgi:hypothetical protein